ncbi:hypothetical protein GQ607_015678 [Colletotrichum asianum]|uniref:Uncharacterized protein n=1 Tax=Colletotrichum asianum TaxID=702518 RepID=A0A8H3W0V4_9PEZI|nr:hypothetical protein GQ607_015678 [Colletotrichum asianum]
MDQDISAVESFATLEDSSADPVVHSDLMAFLLGASRMFLSASLLFKRADELGNLHTLHTMSTTTRSWPTSRHYLPKLENSNYAAHGIHRPFYWM